MLEQDLQAARGAGSSAVVLLVQLLHRARREREDLAARVGDGVPDAAAAQAAAVLDALCWGLDDEEARQLRAFDLEARASGCIEPLSRSRTPGGARA